MKTTIAIFDLAWQQFMRGVSLNLSGSFNAAVRRIGRLKNAVPTADPIVVECKHESALWQSAADHAVLPPVAAPGSVWR